MNEDQARALLRSLRDGLEEACIEAAAPELARRLGRRVSDSETRVYLAQKRAGQQQQIQRPGPRPPDAAGPAPRPPRTLVLKMAARLLARHGHTDVDWR